MSDFGTVTDYHTGTAIRPATAKEWRWTADKLNSGESDARTGAWNDDDGQAVYVDGGPDAEISREDIRALREEAGNAGDGEQARLCACALGEGDEDDEHRTPAGDAWYACAQVILDTRIECAVSSL